MSRRRFHTLMAAGSARSRSSQQASSGTEQRRSVSGPHTSSSPFNISDRAQLFIDRVLVRDYERISFTLHPGRHHPANPLVRPEHPWEGWRTDLCGSVLYDEEEKVFKMWYNGDTADNFEAERPVSPALYAVSSDGISWDKPLVGTVRARSSARHNAVALVDEPSVIKDTRDPDPKRRYKMICWSFLPKDAPSYRTMVSPDGFHWTLSSRTPISPGGDVITGYYDETRKLYVAFPKAETLVRGHLRRVFSVITSPDFQRWSRPELVLTPDLRDDAGSLGRIEEVRSMLSYPDDASIMRTEFYGIGAYVAESCTIAFPWMFTINNNIASGKNQEGPGEIQLAVSRDLVHWDRPFRTPVIPRGPAGEWDSGFFFTESRALRVGDEIWLYYSAGNYTHGSPAVYRVKGKERTTHHTGAIGLACWELDRFVSADGAAEGATLTTVPIVFSGKTLHLNARTRTAGRVVVEVLDAGERPIERYGMSDPVSGDSLRHKIRWRGDGNVAPLAGVPISLKFHLFDAELFGFAFRTLV